MAHFDHSKENAERSKQGMPLLYCPFGCRGAQSSSGQSGAAYCCHLVGFTVDEGERVMEPISTTPWGNGEFFMTSTKGKQRVLKDDIVINPLVKQILTTGVHWAKKWSSARVYRACSAALAEAWRKRFAQNPDTALMAELAAEDKQTRIKTLREELAALEGGEPSQPIEEPEEAEANEAPAWNPPQPGQEGITDNLMSTDPNAERVPGTAGMVSLAMAGK